MVDHITDLRLERRTDFGTSMSLGIGVEVPAKELPTWDRDT